jgi:hypothetical protein
LGDHGRRLSSAAHGEQGVSGQRKGVFGVVERAPKSVMQVTSFPVGFGRDLRASYAKKLMAFNESGGF